MAANEHFTSGCRPSGWLLIACSLTKLGRLLVLEPPYKVSWDIRGGIVEVDESPWQAAQREVLEEVGLEIEPGRLLVLDGSRAGRMRSARASGLDSATCNASDPGCVTPAQPCNTPSVPSTTTIFAASWSVACDQPRPPGCSPPGQHRLARACMARVSLAPDHSRKSELTPTIVHDFSQSRISIHSISTPPTSGGQ